MELSNKNIIIISIARLPSGVKTEFVGGAEVTGTAFSYENNANLTVEVYCDDQKTPASSVALQVEQLVGAPFTLTVWSKYACTIFNASAGSVAV